ncbi:MAG: hypothetical protein ACYS14_13255 [Planctomycetota bacterium]|jgi:hypothetical protein
MKKLRPNSRKYLVYFVTGLSVFLASLLLADSSGSADEMENEIRGLCRTVLSNPIDSTARRRLTGLRRQQLQQRRQALDALIRGLNSFIRQQGQAAAQELGRASQSKYVVDLANSILLTRLEDIIDECRKYKRPATRCQSCLDTGWATCKGCGGAGVRVCLQCRGAGIAGVFSGPGISCRGFTLCKRCAPETGDMGTSEQQAIEKVTAMAAYLRNGGIDFFTRDALKCSPRLQTE